VRRNNIVFLGGRVVSESFAHLRHPTLLAPQARVAFETDRPCRGGRHELIVADEEQVRTLKGFLAATPGSLRATIIGSLHTEDMLSQVFVHRISCHTASIVRRTAVERVQRGSLPVHFPPAPEDEALGTAGCPNQVVLDGVIASRASWSASGRHVMIIDTDKGEAGGRHPIALDAPQKAWVLSCARALGEDVEACVYGRLHTQGGQSLVLVDTIFVHAPPGVALPCPDKPGGVAQQ
jgi:hypothetical protein